MTRYGMDEEGRGVDEAPREKSDNGPFIFMAPPPPLSLSSMYALMIRQHSFYDVTYDKPFQFAM